MKLTITLLTMLCVAVCMNVDSAAAASLCNCQDCVVAVYFHNNVRCATCKTIEAYTKEALEQSFRDEIASGAVHVRVIDTDENGNQQYMADYGLYTKAVVVVLYKDGKQVKFKNLQKVWELTGNKNDFMKYIKDAVARYAKEL